ncbi:MAG: hypothetical protein DRI99_06150 [Candidatus Aminicenantes bacterium]|nr:MAG: hypothetical protein DRI99_06150 [Candidatus Aminicenantes bacterium]RLE03350.1 MAG: hypothetical protein DRJ11_04515 [Candidatus Aminicenantes bacterium]
MNYSGYKLLSDYFLNLLELISKYYSEFLCLFYLKMTNKEACSCQRPAYRIKLNLQGLKFKF